MLADLSKNGMQNSTKYFLCIETWASRKIFTSKMPPFWNRHKPEVQHFPEVYQTFLY